MGLLFHRETGLSQIYALADQTSKSTLRRLTLFAPANPLPPIIPLASRQALRHIGVMRTHLTDPDFQSFEIIDGAKDSALLLICDHAANDLPASAGDLGLGADNLARHIAYDIGAADLTRRLAALTGAPAVLSKFSRLLIDPNRGADDPTLVMRISDGAIIPGNAAIDSQEIERRLNCYWRPYRTAVARAISAIFSHEKIPVVLSIHTFTPIWRGVRRPWAAGLLWDLDDRFAKPLIEALTREGDQIDGEIGDNEPYDGALQGDTMYDLCTAHGLPHALLEVRQDLVAAPEGQEAWAQRIAKILPEILARPELRKIQKFGSRADAP